LNHVMLCRAVTAVCSSYSAPMTEGQRSCMTKSIHQLKISSSNCERQCLQRCHHDTVTARLHAVHLMNVAMGVDLAPLPSFLKLSPIQYLCVIYRT